VAGADVQVVEVEHVAAGPQVQLADGGDVADGGAVALGQQHDHVGPAEKTAPLLHVDVPVGGLVLVGGDLGDHCSDVGGVGRRSAAGRDLPDGGGSRGSGHGRLLVHGFGSVR
jgi:hypothetical protein